jgi:hypothetical protein
MRAVAVLASLALRAGRSLDRAWRRTLLALLDHPAVLLPRDFPLFLLGARTDGAIAEVRAAFEAIYTASDDPWGSAALRYRYQARKYEQIMALLPDRRSTRCSISAVGWACCRSTWRSGRTACSASTWPARRSTMPDGAAASSTTSVSPGATCSICPPRWTVGSISWWSPTRSTTCRRSTTRRAFFLATLLARAAPDDAAPDDAAPIRDPAVAGPAGEDVPAAAPVRRSSSPPACRTG